LPPEGQLGVESVEDLRRVWDRAETPAEAPVVPPTILEPAGPPERTPEADEPAGPTRRERRAERRLAKDVRRGEKLELRRHRILPRTFIGISFVLLAAAIGAAFSGALLYAYYDYRLSTNEDRVGVLAESLTERLESAGESIDEAEQQALSDLQAQLGPLAALESDPVAIEELIPVVLPSTFFVSTLDENGEASVGSAFVVASDDSSSLLLTSYRTVAAGTTSPAPEIRVRNDNGDEHVATLHNWDAEHDLALLTVDVGGLEPLEWATGDAAAVTGERVYPVSGVGGNGVTLSAGLVLDQTDAGIQHDASVGHAWQGGPIVDQDGKVIAVASLAYQPLGFDPGDVHFAAPVGAACEVVLDCGDGAPSAGG
jgi:S1-C subfamily serine protease